ncbi:asparagine synthase (glutamine-hydrolyzing) [Desulfonema magnum]|uniref:asparagine synthase (glutamine-hydrolyzing) n=1 Tax=Desulfonema magnum TaxID=45655 RepID=A0A975GM97_9BACT|nr:asparagine synthase (glutamine-hydrolyzing) [Desulfonema magnum]QTA85618.1 Asparagine synthetase [Desulfonema magnum]
MCGICGFAGKGSTDDLSVMTAALSHRGPDAEGLWYHQDKGIYLGHRRLSVIDIIGGDQPMWTSDQTLGVVFNGEIYNHKELRNELRDRGHVFLSDHSDTEVLLHGFREWGTELPNRLNGMWAFAIYDRTRNILFLSRDRFGKKPLFYTQQNNTFVFASELTALTKHSFVDAAVSQRSLKKYFAYGYIPAPGSLYERVYKLPGGHHLIFNLNNFSLTVSKYWDFVLEPFESVPENPEEEWGEHLRDLLRKAVRRRLMSDVPLGVFLSGGIDSSAITAFAAQDTDSEKLSTFSIGFQEASFDESEYAQRVAELFETDHHLKILSIEEARNMLPEITARLDEPMGDSSLLPTYLLNRETRKNVTVALGGDGGDELFAGYDPFHALKLAELYSKLVPRPVHQGIRMAVSLLPVSHKNISLDFKLKRTLSGLSYPKHLWNPVWLGPLEPNDLEELFQEPADIEDIYSEAIEQWEACSQDNLVDKTLQFYTKLYLQDGILVKADRASMMNSLEVRAPFLDIELVDFVRRIPHEWKYRNGQTKYILKKALEPVLPKTILYRPKKGFGVPIGEWFSKGMLSWPENRNDFFMNKSFIENKIKAHQEGKNDHRLFLWNTWLFTQKESEWNYR